ncbi:MAG: AMP-binding protein [Verrucomicrobiota bacterium]
MRTTALRAEWNRLERESILRLQGQKLGSYLENVVLPFSVNYQRVFEEGGLSAKDIRSVEDLAKIPFTSKEDLLPTEENPRKSLDFAIIPDAEVLRRRPGNILRALKVGPKKLKRELEREFRPSFMTSTTGRSTAPVPFLYTDHDIQNLKLAGLRAIEMGDAQSDERILNMFPYAPHLAYWLVYHAAREANMFCVGTGGGKVMGTTGNLGLIERLKPAILVGMPTFVYHVLHQAVEEKKRFEGIRVLVLGGEKVAEGTRRKLIELCGMLGSEDVKVISTYGFTESKQAWPEAPISRAEESSGFFTYPDLGIVEVIDPETGQVQPEGVGGEVVFTPLDARGTVVLRYRTGDFIEHGLQYSECPITGMTAPRLVGRISRVSDRRSMRFQKVKGTIIDFSELENLLDDTPGMGTYQIELRKKNNDPLAMDELVIHAVADGREESVLKKTLKKRFESQLEIKPNEIHFCDWDEIKERQKVGVEMKELKFIDNREAAGKPAGAVGVEELAEANVKVNEGLEKEPEVEESAA